MQICSFEGLVKWVVEWVRKDFTSTDTHCASFPAGATRAGEGEPKPHPGSPHARHSAGAPQQSHALSLRWPRKGHHHTCPFLVLAKCPRLPGSRSRHTTRRVLCDPGVPGGQDALYQGWTGKGVEVVSGRYWGAGGNWGMNCAGRELSHLTQSIWGESENLKSEERVSLRGGWQG